MGRDGAQWLERATDVVSRRSLPVGSKRSDTGGKRVDCHGLLTLK